MHTLSRCAAVAAPKLASARVHWRMAVACALCTGGRHVRPRSEMVRPESTEASARRARPSSDIDVRHLSVLKRERIPELASRRERLYAYSYA